MILTRIYYQEEIENERYADNVKLYCLARAISVFEGRNDCLWYYLD